MRNRTFSYLFSFIYLTCSFLTVLHRKKQQALLMLKLPLMALPGTEQG